MFIGLWELTIGTSCQSMVHITIYVNLLLGTLLEHLIISKPLDGSDSYMD